MQMRQLIPIAVASGVGLVVGIDRERRKGEGPGRRAAGVRTFIIVALLGVLSSSAPALAAGIGALLAIALAAREPLHRLVRQQLSEQEIHDGLLLAACALVVLPLMPDRAIDPFGAFNPRLVWKFTMLVMAINALGYLALRLFGPGRGLPLAGLAAGFISSSAAHAAMGARARTEPALRAGALAGAAWSSVATFVRLTLVLTVVSLSLLRQLLWPLLVALVLSAATALLLSARSERAQADLGRRRRGLRAAPRTGTAAVHCGWCNHLAADQSRLVARPRRTLWFARHQLETRVDFIRDAQRTEQQAIGLESQLALPEREFTIGVQQPAGALPLHRHGQTRLVIAERNR